MTGNWREGGAEKGNRQFTTVSLEVGGDKLFIRRPIEEGDTAITKGRELY